MTGRERKLLWLLAAVAGVYLMNQVRQFIGAGVSLIKRWEGLRLDAYKDVAGHWTIGYGHLIRPGERFHPYGPVMRITEAEADMLLEQDTRAARNAVTNYVRVPLTDNQRGALESLVFNIGAGAFAGSTLLAKLNAGDYAGAATEFARWNKAGGQVVQGLVNRRADEQRVFMA